MCVCAVCAWMGRLVVVVVCICSDGGGGAGDGVRSVCPTRGRA